MLRLHDRRRIFPSGWQGLATRGTRRDAVVTAALMPLILSEICKTLWLVISEWLGWAMATQT